jgi:hypothetical protein
LLSHQGAYAALLNAIISDAIIHTGYSLTPSFSSQSFGIEHAYQDALRSVYRLKVSGRVSGRDDGGRHIICENPGDGRVWRAGEGSEATVVQTLLLTYDRERGTLSLAFDPSAPPFFSYTLDKLVEPQ